MTHTWTTIILWADLFVFTIYVIGAVRRFGIPINLSITYYRYERIHRNWGMLFPALMFFICLTTIPIWFVTSWHVSLLGRYLSCLPVLTEVGLLAVAFSARYKRWPKLIYFHYTCAIIAAVCAVVWLCVVAWQWPFFWLRIGLLIAFLTAGILTRTLKKCTLFWLELTAFYAIFLTLLFIYLGFFTL